MCPARMPRSTCSSRYKALAQQPRRHQQHHRHRQLHHHQVRSKPPPHRPRRAASAFVSPVAHLWTSGSRTSGVSENSTAAIDAIATVNSTTCTFNPRPSQIWHVASACSRDRAASAAASPPSDSADAKHACRRHQHQPLGNKLPRPAARRRAQRAAHRYLPPAGSRRAPAAGSTRSRTQSAAAVPRRPAAPAESAALSPQSTPLSGITLAPWPSILHPDTAFASCSAIAFMSAGAVASDDAILQPPDADNPVAAPRPSHSLVIMQRRPELRRSRGAK